jgi:membrane protease YdiL (CAAX protease family)
MLPTERSGMRVDRDADAPAPPWHTAALIGVMLAVAVTGSALAAHRMADVPSRAAGSRVTAVYVPMLAVQWGLLFYVCRVGRSRSALWLLLGHRWNSMCRALADLSLAVATFLVIEVCEQVVARLQRGVRSDAMLRILPVTGSERLAWILVSASVGFCEEVVYRGYLQTQLTAFTRSAVLAVAFQSILFGLAHGEQGPLPALRMGVYGLALGLLAAWRGSLLPGIICHVAIDLASGVVDG